MKVAVIGYSGCGKSTIAAWIAKKNQLPLLYLDTVHWLPGWKERPQDEKEQMMKDFLDSHDSWVIDGNYHSLEYERRMREADQILFLDFPRLVCLYRGMDTEPKVPGKNKGVYDRRMSGKAGSGICTLDFTGRENQKEKGRVPTDSGRI